MNTTKHTLGLQRQSLMPSLLLLCAKDTSTFVVDFDSDTPLYWQRTPECLHLGIIIVHSHKLPRTHFMMLNTTLRRMRAKAKLDPVSYDQSVIARLSGSSHPVRFEEYPLASLVVS